MKRAVICDLDGTLCLFNGRGPFEMEKCGDDLPNNAVLAAVQALAFAGYIVLFVTGRFESCREQTVEWLTRYGLAGHHLYMRADGDYRKDSEIKPELYAAHIQPHYDVAFALDDRKQSVECWRSLGVPCFQVAPGDF